MVPKASASIENIVDNGLLCAWQIPYNRKKGICWNGGGEKDEKEPVSVDRRYGIAGQ